MLTQQVRIALIGIEYKNINHEAVTNDKTLQNIFSHKAFQVDTNFQILKLIAKDK